MVWKGLLTPAHGWEFRESALKPSDADQGHKQTLLIISKVGGRTASPSVHSLEILGPCFYCTGSSRLTAEKLHSSSAAATCSNTTTQTYREVQYGTELEETWGFTPKRKPSSLSSNVFIFKDGDWVLVFSYCSLLYTVRGVVLFGDCLFTLLSMYTDESLKSLIMGPKHCDEILSLRVLDGKNWGVFHVLRDQKTSAPASQRAIYKNKISNSGRNEQF